MQLHQLKPIHRKKSRKRVGRGGKRGTYSGRGIKGQKSRAGKKPRLSLAGGSRPFESLPKQRGSVGKVKIKRGVKLSRLRRRRQPIIINFKTINERFKDNEIISKETLLKKGLINKIKGRLPEVKILGKGKLALKNIKFQNLKLSKKVYEMASKNRSNI